MKHWNGKMITNEFTADVNIQVTEPNNFILGEWHGYGKANGKVDCKDYHTNIGTIIVTRLNVIDMTFSFQGSGELNIK